MKRPYVFEYEVDACRNYISILCPSRARVAMLRKSFDSLLNTAKNSKGIEFLVRVDWQDGALQDYIDLMKEYKGKLVIGDRLNGYASMHHFYNELGHIATGRYLFLWNDDVVMLEDQKGWDRKLAEFDENLYAYIHVADNMHTGEPCFPIFTKTLIELQGGFVSQHHACDAWLSVVFRGTLKAYAGSLASTIRVTHERPDIAGTEPDETYNGRHTGRGQPWPPPGLQDVCDYVVYRLQQAGDNPCKLT